MRLLTVRGYGAFTAGPKAPSDIIEILEKNCKVKNILLIKGENFFQKIKYRLKMYFTFISNFFMGDILIIQFPMYETTKFLNSILMFFLNFVRKDKTIAIIHDVDGLREDNEERVKQDIARLNKIGHVIVHNEKMNKKLKELGLKSNLYNLELFDYICNEGEEVKQEKFDKNNVKVAYAGNLTESKSPFLHQLDYKKLNFTICLYGLGIDKDMNEKMVYKGKREPNDLPNEIEADLGLIWDGNFDESDQYVGFKNYERIINPHKLSCYIASGKPVIVWKNSAAADFVKKYDIGYTVSTVYDINELDFSNYNKKLENVKNLKEKVRNAFFTQQVMNQVLQNIKEK